MKRFINISCLIVLLFFSRQSYAQDSQKEIWSTLLYDVTIKYRYSIEYNAFMPKIKFGDKLKAMDGKKITLHGFYLPTDLTGMIFILSYAPSKMCFFCSGAGIESIVELNPKEEEKKKFEKLKTDNYFEVTGKLRLNADDNNHLIYILDDAEFIKIIQK
jgi:hypothetical protein